MGKAYVFIPQDIPHRATDTHTWVEAGTYPVIKRLERDRYLIVLNPRLGQRLLTIVRKSETQ